MRWMCLADVEVRVVHQVGAVEAQGQLARACACRRGSRRMRSFTTVATSFSKLKSGLVRRVEDGEAAHVAGAFRGFEREEGGVGAFELMHGVSLFL